MRCWRDGRLGVGYDEVDGIVGRRERERGEEGIDIWKESDFTTGKRERKMSQPTTLIAYMMDGAFC